MPSDLPRVATKGHARRNRCAPRGLGSRKHMALRRRDDTHRQRRRRARSHPHHWLASRSLGCSAARPASSWACPSRTSLRHPLGTCSWLLQCSRTVWSPRPRWDARTSCHPGRTPRGSGGMTACSSGLCASLWPPGLRAACATNRCARSSRTNVIDGAVGRRGEDDALHRAAGRGPTALLAGRQLEEDQVLGLAMVVGDQRPIVRIPREVSRGVELDMPERVSAPSWRNAASTPFAES